MHRLRQGRFFWIDGTRSADGRTVPDLMGKPVFLATISASHTLDTAGLRTAALLLRGSGARIVVFTDRPEEILARRPFAPGQGYVVGADLGAVQHRLGVAGPTGRWWYFRASGGLLATGSLFGDDIVAALGPAAARDQAGIPRAIRAGIVSLDEHGGFDRERAAAAAAPGRRLSVLLVNYACTGCVIADVIRAFDQPRGSGAPRSCAFVVPSSWARTQLAAFRANYQLHCRVALAGAAATSAWQKLADRYGVLRTNGIAIQFGPNGIVAMEADVLKAPAFVSRRTP